MGSKFSDPQYLFWGSCPFEDPNICQNANVCHLSTDFHNVGVFYGFSRVLSWFIINSNQPEVYLTNFRSTESKRWIPLLSSCSPTTTRTKIYSNYQHSADLCEILSAHVYCCCNIYTVNHYHWLIVIWFTIANILPYYCRIRAVFALAFSQKGARQTIFGATASALATCFAGNIWWAQLSLLPVGQEEQDT